jgi:dimethylaniline monooxygenase (N-oxide forming)
MNRYLQRYSDQFNLQSCITFQSKVTRVQACVPADLSEYKVEWMNTETKVFTTEIFDAVVVACGFFNEAIGSNTSSSAECGLINSETSINSIHCSHYTSPAFCANKNVLVVGSSFSSTELTSELSFVAKNVYNLQTKPIYPLSRYLPLNPLHPASSRLPLDLLFYRYHQADDTSSSSSSSSEVKQEIIVKSAEERMQTKKFLNLLLFGEPSPEHGKATSFIPPELVQATNEESFAQCGISETFASQRFNGNIKVKFGRYQSHHGKSVLYLSNGDGSSAGDVETELEGIDVIIDCRGYKPDLSCLDKSILQVLQYDPQETHFPLLLYKSFCHPDVRNLFFVGCYKGPYFLVMELQAVS